MTYARSLRIHQQQVVPDKRAEGLLAAMRAEYEQEIERLKQEDPDWVQELLDRLS